jgi:hypothetical protein
MCLYSHSVTPLIAEKDITVYKVLDKSLLSPYESFEYEFNKLFSTSKEDKHIIYDEFKWQYGTVKAIIHKGYFHAFQDKISAEQEVDMLTSFDYEEEDKYIKDEYKDHYFVYEAVIPKGSRYFLGYSNEICSEEIIIKQKLIKY